jgi:hypothetical protein
MIDFPISLFNSPKGLKSGKTNSATYLESIAKWMKKRISIFKPHIRDEVRQNNGF